MISTGEQVTIALLAMAIRDLGLKAKSYTGSQVKVLTDSTFTKARILGIDDANIRRDLDDDAVVVVAGFQGIDADGNIPQKTTTRRCKSERTRKQRCVVILGGQIREG